MDRKIGNKKRNLSLVVALIAVWLFMLMPVRSAKLAASFLSPLEGKYTNILVQVQLKGQPDFFSSVKTQEIMALYNDTAPLHVVGNMSVKKYFEHMSNGKFEVTTMGLNENFIVKFDQEQGYFEPLSEDNIIGFKSEEERDARETELVKAVINEIKTRLPIDLDLDVNNDKILDLLTLYVSGVSGAGANRSTILYPHMTVTDGLKVEVPNGVMPIQPDDTQLITNENLRVQNYIILGDSFIYHAEGIIPPDTTVTYSSGVVCHELLHAMNKLQVGGRDYGINDLYHYTPTESMTVPVGMWDIMGSTLTEQVQPLNAYYRSLFGWTTLQQATSESRYTLLPMGAGGSNAIKFADQEGQFFIIENRQPVGAIDGWLDETIPNAPNHAGLVVYRVNSKLAGQGNMSGRDEVLFFRNNRPHFCFIPDHPNIHNQEGMVDDQSCPFFSATFSNGDNFVDFVYDGEGLSNYELALHEIVQNKDGSVTFTLSQDALIFAKYPVSGSLVDKDGKLITDNQVSIYINNEYMMATRDGKFTLEKVPHGAVISFKSTSYSYGSLKVTSAVENVSILATRNPGAIRVPLYVGGILVLIFAVAFIYYIGIDSRRKFRFRKRRK